MKKLLILDLYHTLIYVSRLPLEREADADVVGMYVYKRPGFDSFFEKTEQYFDIAIWTNDERERAKQLVEAIIDLEKLTFLWTKDECDVRAGKYFGMQAVKNISKVSEAFQYKENDIIMIDDSPENIDAGESTVIGIKPYGGESDDAEFERVWQMIS